MGVENFYTLVENFQLYCKTNNITTEKIDARQIENGEYKNFFIDFLKEKAEPEVLNEIFKNGFNMSELKELENIEVDIYGTITLKSEDSQEDEEIDVDSKIEEFIDAILQSDKIVSALDENSDKTIGEAEKTKLRNFLKLAYNDETTQDDMLASMFDFNVIKQLFSDNPDVITDEHKKLFLEAIGKNYNIENTADIKNDTLLKTFLDSLKGDFPKIEVPTVEEPETPESPESPNSSGNDGNGYGDYSPTNTTTPPKPDGTDAAVKIPEKDYTSVTLKDLKETELPEAKTLLDNSKTTYSNTIEAQKKSLTEADGAIKVASQAYDDSLKALSERDDEIGVKAKEITEQNQKVDTSNETLLTCQENLAQAELNLTNASIAKIEADRNVEIATTDKLNADTAVEEAQSTLDSTPEKIKQKVDVDEKGNPIFDEIDNPKYKEAKEALDAAKEEQAQKEEALKEAQTAQETAVENENAAKEAKDEADKALNDETEGAQALYDAALVALHTLETELDELVEAYNKDKEESEKISLEYQEKREALNTLRTESQKAVNEAKINFTTAQKNRINCEKEITSKTLTEKAQAQERTTEENETIDAWWEKIPEDNEVLEKIGNKYGLNKDQILTLIKSTKITLPKGDNVTQEDIEKVFNQAYEKIAGCLLFDK